MEDLKERVLRPGEETTTEAVLWQTVRALGELPDEGQFDALVVSGDVSQASAQAGFDAFEGFLELLGGKRPPPERTLVVPGNHDVVWGTPSSSNERYERFLGATRMKGYVTPVIDGIDFEPTALGGYDTERLNAHPHVVEHPDFLIVGLNSSNWCGVLADFKPGSEENPALDEQGWVELLDTVGDPDVKKKAEASLRLMRLHDLPRVSWGQLAALSQFLQERGIYEEDGRLRVAVMHHHLLPVSSEEELKTFESITDLAVVRRFLRALGFHLVLHGHKHRGALYVDAGSLPAPELGDSRNIFVVASPADSKPSEELFRVLEVKGERGGHWILAHTFPALEPGGPGVAPSTQEIPVWTAEQGPRRDLNIRGETRDDVYARILAMFQSATAPRFIHNLLCTINRPDNAQDRPGSYPNIEHPRPDNWFSAIVSWWQRPRSRLLSFRSFNHGERINDRYGDQLARAARALEDDPDTSRACVVLVDPGHEAGFTDVDFPAFVLAQFKLTEVRKGHRRLDVVGVFRKQEMTYWWPINAAELAKMQEALLTRLTNSARLKVGLAVGSISTFSVMGYVGTDIPDVDVADLDLALDEPGRLARMVTAIVTGSQEPTAVADWDLAFEEMAKLRAGRLVIPRRGWAEVADLLEAVKPLAPERVEPVLTRIRALLGVVDLVGTSSEPEQFGLAPLMPAIQGAREAVEAALNSPPKS